MSTSGITAIALYSGGLDSTLACRVVAAQGIRVIAVKFVTPFFGYDLLGRQQEHVSEVMEKYSIELRLQDITAAYLQMLGNPPHGYGKNFNPCIDCKILLLARARQLMEQWNGSFLITGEVIGQRPMSQRKDTLRVIERDSGCEGLLVRPLCARRLAPTRPEIEGLVDRDRLLDFSGRSRTPQIRLAEDFGITDYPNPAGGCMLTDPNLAGRIARYYREHDAVLAEDILLLLTGRHFRLPHGGWLVLGRNERENQRILALRQPTDYHLFLRDRPGPTGLARYTTDPQDLQAAAGLVVRYGRKPGNSTRAATVILECGRKSSSLTVSPLDDWIFQTWRR